MLDEIDQELLRQCEMNPGQTVATIISPLLNCERCTDECNSEIESMCEKISKAGNDEPAHRLSLIHI